MNPFHAECVRMESSCRILFGVSPPPPFFFFFSVLTLRSLLRRTPDEYPLNDVSEAELFNGPRQHNEKNSYSWERRG